MQQSNEELICWTKTTTIMIIKNRAYWNRISIWQYKVGQSSKGKREEWRDFMIVELLIDSWNFCLLLSTWFTKVVGKNYSVGREPWSSGYGSRLKFWRSWVWIPLCIVAGHFFTFICCKNCSKRRKLNWKRGRKLTISKKNYSVSEVKKTFFFTTLNFFVNLKSCFSSRELSLLEISVTRLG